MTSAVDHVQVKQRLGVALLNEKTDMFSGFVALLRSKSRYVKVPSSAALRRSKYALSPNIAAKRLYSAAKWQNRP